MTLHCTAFPLLHSSSLDFTAGGRGGANGRKFVFPEGGLVGGRGEEGSIAGLVLERHRHKRQE